MKFSLAVCLTVALLAAASFAQITIHSGDFSPIGYSYTWGTANEATFSVGSGGANQSWNFGAYTFDSAERRTFVAPGTTPHGDQFPSATRAEAIVPQYGNEVESYSYQQITPSAFMQLGQAAGDSVFIFNPPMENAPLPMSYGMQWHTLMRYDINIDTIAMTFTDSLAYSADGWGTITTPYGSWPVLRMFVHHWITVTMMGFPIGSYQFVGYTWVNQQGNSVLVVSSSENVIDPNFTTGTLAMMGVPLSAEPTHRPVAEGFSVGQNYPNPFNPVTEIPVTLDHLSPVTLDVYDVLGGVVSHQTFMLTAGSHALTVDGSRWASGIYFARVSAGSQQRVLKMNLLK